MASVSFQPGDRVQLKSGGPIMTVNEIDDRNVWCKWFDSKGELKENAFVPETLKKLVE